jgi:hypothetical protein
VKRALGIAPADALVAFLYIGTEAQGRDAQAPRPDWHDRVTDWPVPGAPDT